MCSRFSRPRLTCLRHDADIRGRRHATSGIVLLPDDGASGDRHRGGGPVPMTTFVWDYLRSTRRSGTTSSTPSTRCSARGSSCSARACAASSRSSPPTTASGTAWVSTTARTPSSSACMRSASARRRGDHGLEHGRAHGGGDRRGRRHAGLRRRPSQDYLMDIDQVAAAITARTRCLLPVHLYGQCVDMAPLRLAASTAW